MAIDSDVGADSSNTVVGSDGEHAPRQEPIVIAEVPSNVRTAVTDEERQLASDIVGSSSLLREFGGSSGDVTGVALWSDDAGDVIGIVATVPMQEGVVPFGAPVLAPAPRAADGTLTDRPADAPYEVMPAPFEASGVSELRVFIDLRGEAQIVAVSPDLLARVVWDEAYLAERDAVADRDGGL